MFRCPRCLWRRVIRDRTSFEFLYFAPTTSLFAVFRIFSKICKLLKFVYFILKYSALSSFGFRFFFFFVPYVFNFTRTGGKHNFTVVEERYSPRLSNTRRNECNFLFKILPHIPTRCHRFALPRMFVTCSQ